jgi:hypothetical protein
VITTDTLTSRIADSRIATAGTRRHSASVVVTLQDFSAQPEVVWEALMFYEEIAESPAFFLRRLVPVPLGTEGCKFEVGGEVKCRYVSGHLLKRVTQITQARNYAFEVIEQNLTLGGGIKLLGGYYTLRKLSENRTRVAMATRYASPYHPRWLCGRLEALVCHSFHRHIFAAMRSNLRPRSTARKKQ